MQDTLSELKLTEAEFTHAKELYLEFRNTSEYKQVNASIKETAEKLNGQMFIALNRSDIESAESLERYKKKLAKKLTTKIKFTQFKTVDEAVVEIVQKLMLVMELNAKHPELFELLNKASTKQAKEITTYGKGE